MTVQIETPYIKYSGNGVTTVFAFAFASLDSGDIYVRLNDEDITEGIEYELENYDRLTGGDIVFPEPLDSTDEVHIFRSTPVNQETDYVDDEPFPVDTHELAGLDKDTFILQEIIDGGRVFDGNVDLGVTQRSAAVDITNTAGEDATINPWECAGQYAGVFMGEITNSAPADGAATTKPDGYMWIEVDGSAPAPENGILMPTTQLDLSSVQSEAGEGYAVTGITLQISANYSIAVEQTDTAELVNPLFETAPTGVEQMWVRLDINSGSLPNTSTPVNQWVDAWVNSGSGIAWLFYQYDIGTKDTNATLRIAPDNGAGAADEAFEVTRTITFNEQVTS